MLYPGQKIKIFGKDVIALVCLENEVLIFIEQNHLRWVDKSLIELPQPA